MEQENKKEIENNIELYKQNRKTVVYIAGPITKEQDYKAKFDKAEKILKQKGYSVFNPSVFPLGMEYESYIRICKVIIAEVDVIYMLTGWRKSEGAKIEHNHARQLGKEIKYQNTEEIA